MRGAKRPPREHERGAELREGEHDEIEVCGQRSMGSRTRRAYGCIGTSIAPLQGRSGRTADRSWRRDRSARRSLDRLNAAATRATQRPSQVT
jgi:hypothetical protein